MATSNRIKSILIWVSLIVMFAMIIVRPDIAGIGYVASLCGWLVVVTAICAHWYVLAASMSAENSDDNAKRDKSLAFLRDVNARLATHGKARRALGDGMLASLVILIAFTGHIFLALLFIVARALRALSEFTSTRVVEEHDAATATQSPAPAN